MDSLVGVEVKQTIERDYDLVLSMQQVRELTVKRLLEISAGNLGAVDGATTSAKAKGECQIALLLLKEPRLSCTTQLR